MKKNCFLVILFCLFFVSCWKGGTANTAGLQAEEQKGRAEYRKISAEDASRFMREAGAFILLDVRTEAEYRETRIPGSRLLPDNEISVRAAAELPDKNTPILVYCRSGRRSEGAARELAGMGYTQVYDMGGILNWPYEKEGE